MEIHEAVKQSAPGWEGTIRQLLRVEEKDVSLKGIFDYFRNYLICAGLLGGAALFAKHGALLASVPTARQLLAFILVLMTFVLMTLNLFQGVVLLSAFGARRWVGFLLGAFMFFAMFDVAITVGFYGK